MTVIRPALNAGRKASGSLVFRRANSTLKPVPAESTLYHLAPKGFWKKFRDAIVVNPEISTGLPLPSVNRYPQPGSRPEKYSTPATLASDPARNPYWKRDARRQYPRLSVVDQSELAQLLLASPDIPADAKQTAIATAEGEADLVKAIAVVSESKKAFTATNLPPKPPTLFKWQPKQSPATPHDPLAYFPMDLYS